MIFLQISIWFIKFKKKNCLQIITENIICKYDDDSFGIKIGLILEVKLAELVYKNVSCWSLFIKLHLMRFKFALGEERWRQSDFTLRCSLNILAKEFFIPLEIVRFIKSKYL